jgi:hypothetical protein
LCWPGIEKFVEKYGPHRLTRHPGYQHWKQKVGK